MIEHNLTAIQCNAYSVWEQQQAEIRERLRQERIREAQAQAFTWRCPTCGHTWQEGEVSEHLSCPKGPHEGHPGRWPICYY